MLKRGGTLTRKHTLSMPEEGPPSKQQHATEDETDGGERVARAAGGGTGNSGQHGIAPGESVSPIERPIPYKHVTFTFTQHGDHRLYNRDTFPTISYDDLIGPNKTRHLVAIPGTDDFELLHIYGIKGTVHGNLENHNKMYQGYVLNDLDAFKYKQYSVAATKEDKAWGKLTYAYGIVDESGDDKTTTSKWAMKKRAIAKCKNLDKIEILGASDTVEFEVETNLEGDILYPDDIDDFTHSRL